MPRRFRRRPSRWLLFLLALLTLVALRITYDRVLRRHRHARPEALRAGPCEVLRVVAGDTLVVRQRQSRPDGSPETYQATVRLLAVACPAGDQFGGAQAAALTREFLGRGAPSLRFDLRRVDRHERFLAYVFVDDQLLNAALLRAGWATLDLHEGDSQSLARQLRAAEQEARRDGRGLWARPEGDPASGPR